MFSFLFVSLFDMLHVDAYISQSVVIKMASRVVSAVYIAILATMTPISPACAFMISPLIQHSCHGLPRKCEK